MIKIDDLCQALLANGEAAVRIRLPSGELIPAHFHVTEIGRVDKNFIDCGGTRRQSTTCVMQTWTADDFDHRLVAGKLANILKLAGPVLGSSELPVEVEYGQEAAAQYIVTGVISSFGEITITLAGKRTECLAKDKCGVNGCATPHT